MRYLLGGLLALACLTGCGGEKKPDPRQRPDFVDTTDPTKVMMPALPKPGGGPPGAQPGGQK
ncbi:MAG TPA: hypothetical protein VMV10_18355 [Pirellulales bacterium]|nr:hypothetical protein [Pirellulales bacterium]